MIKANHENSRCIICSIYTIRIVHIIAECLSTSVKRRELLQVVSSKFEHNLAARIEQMTDIEFTCCVIANQVENSSDYNERNFAY